MSDKEDLHNLELFMTELNNSVKFIRETVGDIKTDLEKQGEKIDEISKSVEKNSTSLALAWKIILFCLGAVITLGGWVLKG